MIDPTQNLHNNRQQFGSFKNITPPFPKQDNNLSGIKTWLQKAFPKLSGDQLDAAAKEFQNNIIQSINSFMARLKKEQAEAQKRMKDHIKEDE
ncbi:MAG: hypothetical protein VXZ72_02900 [Chlamydiota bacterium]|nr:hypothetical protein [Chlamydiota bacterium]